MSREIRYLAEYRELRARRIEHPDFKEFDFPEPKFLLPANVEELSQMVASTSRLKIGGSSEYRYEKPGGRTRLARSKDGKLVRTEGPPRDAPMDGTLLLDKMDRVISFHPSDQLVCVQSGILLSSLNDFLRNSGFEIPIGLQEEDQTECVGDLIALNLPHWNMAKGGSWRDWIVRMKIVLASGEVVVSGANVVKNVTGFDLHKLMIGARCTLGVISEITLRVKPYLGLQEFPPILLQHGELVMANPADFKAICARLQPEADKGSIEWFTDEASGLILTEQTRMFEDIPHFSWRSHVHEYALPEFSESQKKLMKRTKEIFDPTYKLNPGEFGFI